MGKGSRKCFGLRSIIRAPFPREFLLRADCFFGRNGRPKCRFWTPLDRHGGSNIALFRNKSWTNLQKIVPGRVPEKACKIDRKSIEQLKIFRFLRCWILKIEPWLQPQLDFIVLHIFENISKNWIFPKYRFWTTNQPHRQQWFRRFGVQDKWWMDLGCGIGWENFSADFRLNLVILRTNTDKERVLIKWFCKKYRW